MNEQNIVCTPSISAVNNSTGGLALLWLSVEFSGLSDFSAYKTEMDSFAQFIRDECKLDPDIKYPASKLYETYRHYCQAIGRKPQSTAAFKKALGFKKGAKGPIVLVPSVCWKTLNEPALQASQTPLG